jgi:hypothetical protein
MHSSEPCLFGLRKRKLIDLSFAHRSAIAGKIPQDQAQGVSSNTQSAVQALGGTVGGGVKGLVDTVGNTVGALGEGVTGTVQGVGDGVGSTVQFAGGALGAGAGKVGSMFSGNKQGGSEGEEYMISLEQLQEAEHDTQKPSKIRSRGCKKPQKVPKTSVQKKWQEHPSRNTAKTPWQPRRKQLRMIRILQEDWPSMVTRR